MQVPLWHEDPKHASLGWPHVAMLHAAPGPGHQCQPELGLCLTWGWQASGTGLVWMSHRWICPKLGLMGF